MASNGTNFGMWDLSVWDQGIAEQYLQLDKDCCWKDAFEAYKWMEKVIKREREEEEKLWLDTQLFYQTEEGQRKLERNEQYFRNLDK